MRQPGEWEVEIGVLRQQERSKDGAEVCLRQRNEHSKDGLAVRKRRNMRKKERDTLPSFSLCHFTSLLPLCL